MLPKIIHKKLCNVLRRPVISNCVTRTEKVSGFLDNQPEPVLREGMSYIKDSNDFIHKIRDLKDIPSDLLLFTVDVAVFYPSITHEAGLQVLKEVLKFRKGKKSSTNDFIKMAALVLINNYSEFNGEVKHQISGTAIGRKFASPYVSIFMDEVETNLLDTQGFKSLVWFRYGVDVFFILTYGKEKLEEFLKILITTTPTLNLAISSKKKILPFCTLR